MRQDWMLEINEDCEKNLLFETKLSFLIFIDVQCINNIKSSIFPKECTQIILIVKRLRHLNL